MRILTFSKFIFLIKYFERYFNRISSLLTRSVKRCDAYGAAVACQACHIRKNRL